MPEPDLNFIGEQMERMLREQASSREENREIRAALAAIVQKLNRLVDRIDVLAGDVSLLTIEEVRALRDRLNGAAQ